MPSTLVHLLAIGITFKNFYPWRFALTLAMVFCQLGASL